MPLTVPENSFEWLSSRILFGMKAGLENIEELTRRLGNPQNDLRTLHVAGSNGKGSVASFLAALGTASGLRTALFTSPHLVSVRERFRIDGVPIDQATLERHLCGVRRAAEMEPPLPVTFFEVLTATAFLWFSESGVDLAILEVGLGGRLDSTNIARSSLSVITSISLEHEDILGSSEVSILKEKAGVLRPGSICVHALPPHLQKELCKIAEEGGSVLESLLPSEWSLSSSRELFVSYAGVEYDLGDFSTMPVAMARNRALAFKAFSLLLKADVYWKKRIHITADQVQQAVRAHRWAARFQLLKKNGRPDLLIDGAHNPEAIDILAGALRSLFPNRNCTFIMGVVNDKRIKPMIEALLPMAERFLFVRTPYLRFREPEELDQLLAGRRESHCFGSDLRSALQCAWRCREPVVACGSLYLMGALISELRFEYDELDWFRQFDPDDNETR